MSQGQIQGACYWVILSWSLVTGVELQQIDELAGCHVVCDKRYHALSTGEIKAHVHAGNRDRSLLP